MQSCRHGGASSLCHEIPERCDGSHADPRHRTLADIEHVGDDRLVFAIEQQLHDKALTGREVWNRVCMSSEDPSREAAYSCRRLIIRVSWSEKTVVCLLFRRWARATSAARSLVSQTM